MASFLSLSGLLCLALFAIVPETNGNLFLYALSPRLNITTKSGSGAKSNFGSLKTPPAFLLNFLKKKPAPIRKQQCGSCTCCITINAPMYKCCGGNCNCENSYVVYANQTSGNGNQIINSGVAPSAGSYYATVPPNGPAPPVGATPITGRGNEGYVVAPSQAPSSSPSFVVATTLSATSTAYTYTPPVPTTYATAPPTQPTPFTAPIGPTGTPASYSTAPPSYSAPPAVATPGPNCVPITNNCNPVTTNCCVPDTPTGTTSTLIVNPPDCVPISTNCNPVTTNCCTTQPPPPPPPCQRQIITTTTTAPATTQPPCTVNPTTNCICTTSTPCQVRPCPTAQPCICDCTNCQTQTATPVTNPPVTNPPVIRSTENPIIIIPTLPPFTQAPITFPTATPGPIYSPCCLVSLQGINAQVICGCNSQITHPNECQPADVNGLCHIHQVFPINSVNAYTSVGRIVSCEEAVATGFLSEQVVSSTCGGTWKFPGKIVIGTHASITVPQVDEYTTSPTLPVGKDSYVNVEKTSAASGISALVLAGIAVYISL